MVVVELEVAGPRIESVLVLPRQAIFEEDGRSISYVRTGESFEPRDVKVVHRGEVDVAVEGLEAGTEVALVRPPGVTAGSSSGSDGPSAGATSTAPATRMMVGQ